MILALAGGVGGAKLAKGLAAVLAPGMDSALEPAAAEGMAAA